ncbi:anti-sigma factor [Rhizobiaceae sp. 2RAB30]
MSEGDTVPTDAADLGLLIHALADGELDAATALSLERRMASNPHLAAEYQRIVALKKAINRLPRPEVREQFRQSIAGIGFAPATVAQSSGRLRSVDWRAMAASMLMAALLGSGATYWAMVGATVPDDLAAAMANDHRRSLLAASPVDVASSDRHTVKPWLDGRVGVSPPAVDLAKDGFSLVGGRVEILGDRPVPALVYRHREHLITLVAVPLEPSTTPVTTPEDLSAGGFSLVHWTDGAFSYWAISDTERAALQDFVARFRTAAVGG